MSIVEDHAEKTQRKPDKFAEQCVIQEYERYAIKYVMTDISSQIGVSTHSSKNNNEMWESRGRYTIHFCKTDNRGVGIGEDNVFWHDSKREKMQLKALDLFIFAIRRYSHVNGFTDEFKVTGNTTFKVDDNVSDNSVKYYANEYMNSQKRYDYAMSEVVLDDRTIATCPAMILGFVQYNITMGIPTPQFTGEEELSLNTKKTWLLTTSYMW
jgi:hypothetical protein